MEVEPGKRKKRMVKVGELTDSGDVSIPFIVVNGVEEGPTLVLRGGEHGSEYSGQEQVRRASLEVSPSKLSGVIIAVPNCNPLAYRNGTYKNVKVYDLAVGGNITYPGNPKGTFDQRVSNIIWEEALSKADVTLTMHDGATHWIARYIAGVTYTAEKKKLGKRVLEIAKAFGVGMPIHHAEIPAYRGIGAELAKRDVPFMTPELGGTRMLWKDDAEKGVKGINNVMKHLGMIDGEPEPSKQIIFNEQMWVRCNNGGVIRPAFSPLDIPLNVDKGEELCTITNLLGDELEVIESPFKGVVFCARSHCAAHTGDWLYGVGKIK
jgi:predicted deacylase